MCSASILSPLKSCTPFATWPAALPSINTRLTFAAVLISAPKSVADLHNESIRPLTPPAGIEWAPLELPAMRYSMVSTAPLGDRGANLDPMSPSQLKVALRTSFSKYSSIRSRAGREATLRNSPMSFFPRRRTFNPMCPNVIMSLRLVAPIRGIVLSQKGFSTAAKRRMRREYLR